MSRLTQQSGDDSRYILVAKLDNARNLLNILKAVHFKEVSFIDYYIHSWYTSCQLQGQQRIDHWSFKECRTTFKLFEL